jgi:hypothetical protein
MENAPHSIVLEDTKVLPIADLKVNPRNYLNHPDEEVAEIEASIKMHGLYRPVVVANDLTLLAGHGVVKTLIKMGYDYVEGVQKDYAPDDPRAIALLVGDNEIGRLAERDDRVMTDNVKFIKDATNQLGGTGFDEQRLMGVRMVSVPASELRNRGEAADWADMPEYVEQSPRLKVVVFFPSTEDRDEFGKLLGVDMSKVGNSGLKQVLWWPHRVINDLKSVVFTDAPETKMIVTETVEQAEVPDGWVASGLRLETGDPVDALTQGAQEVGELMARNEAAVSNVVRPDFSGNENPKTQNPASAPTGNLDDGEG